jgi:DNA repair protein RadC
MKIKDPIKQDMPRERMEKYGAGVLSNSDLIAILLGCGSKKENVMMLASKILKHHNINALSQLSVPELTSILGIGEAKACKIVACFELGRRLASFTPQEKIKINSSKDIEKIFLPKMSHLKKEHFKVIHLNTRKQIIKEKTIFIGCLDSSIVHPREIFKSAINQGAAAIIIMHNHPSGDPTPSTQDLEITSQIINSGKIIGIEVLDHIIIGKKIHSIREKNPKVFNEF